MSRTSCRSIVPALMFALTLALGGGALLPAPAAAGDDMILFYSGGLDRILVDEKDQGLKNALGLIDERILELPGELHQPMIPAGLIVQALELLKSPQHLRLGLLDEGEGAQGVPIRGQWTIETAAEGQAKECADAVLGFLGGIFGPLEAQEIPGMPGLSRIDRFGVPIFFGATRIGGREALVLAGQEVQTDPVNLGSLDLPRGVEPVMAFRLDYREYGKLLGMAPIDAKELEALDLFGFFGPDAGVLTMVMGYDEEVAHGTVRYSNFRPFAEKLGYLAEEPLSARDLALVPADATAAQVSRVNFSGLGKMFERMITLAAEGEDVFGKIAEETGIHPIKDLLDLLGDTVGFYLSDTTGGGGLLSAVAFVRLEDEEAFAATLERIVATLNGLGSEQAKGYVQVRSRTAGDRQIHSLHFPGLPVPIGVHCAIAGGVFYAAASEPALQGAIEQGKGGRPGLLDNPGFRGMVSREELASAIGVAFTDVPRFAGDGYSLLALACTALANAVRSPSDPARDPGSIIPDYHSFLKGARPSVTLSYWQGDDIVSTIRSDRSWMVNTAGTLGNPVLGAVIAGVGAAAIPTVLAVRQTKERAASISSAANLHVIAAALRAYWVARGEAPESLGELVSAGYCEAKMLASPAGSALDAKGDYWFDLAAAAMPEGVNPHRIVGYDRGMYASSGHVWVMFGDGSVRKLQKAEFDSLIRSDPNKGTDFHLPPQGL
ncbi:MAG: hypothetical protein ACE5GW_09230 [Planctomycetota bacterium]